MTQKFLRDDGTFQPIASTGSSSAGPITLITNALTGDVTLTTTNFFDGPSVAQGTSGIWFASGQITMTSTNATTLFPTAKLWDGTTVIASQIQEVTAVGQTIFFALSGFIASPAGNIRISASQQTGSSMKIRANQSGVGNTDSVITAVRIG